MSNGV